MAEEAAGGQGPRRLNGPFGWLADSASALARGAAMTLFLILVTGVLGTVLSVLGAAARRGGGRLLGGAVGFYVELIRNTPFLAQIFFVFFGLPAIGLRLGNVTAAIVAMTVNLSAYGIEIVRSGLDAVPRGQAEAAAALGLGRLRAFVSVILPQAFRIMFPSLSAQIVITMLESAVVSQIAVRDLTYEADLLQSRTFLAFQTYAVVTVIYLALATLLRRAMQAGARLVLTAAPI